MVIYSSKIQHVWWHTPAQSRSQGCLMDLSEFGKVKEENSCARSAEWEQVVLNTGCVGIVWEVPHLWKFIVKQWTDGS